MKSPEEILKEYNIGIIENIKPLQGGIIHKTWLVKTDSGEFILQKVNPIYTPLVMEDLKAVFEYLKSKGFTVAEIIETKNKSLYAEDENGFWRVSTFIEGKTYEEVTDPKIAYEAGRILGRYHKNLSNFNYTFKHQRKIKHNIPLLYKKYRESVENNTNPDINKMIPIVDKMIELNLPSNLRHTVNHGDPKISNCIFNNSTIEAIAMIDFDDCGKNYNVLYELGGAFRSWSWKPEIKSDSFDLSYFTESLRGYCEGSQDYLTEEEWSLVPQALKLNLLQLISRFIRDYFEDSYFEWDRSAYQSRKEHNLARAKEHFALYEDICKKEELIKRAVAEVTGSSTKS